MTDYRLDKQDYRILRILQENSKITNLDLSKTIGLSPAPTLERVKKLEQAGKAMEAAGIKVAPTPADMGTTLKKLLS